MIPVNKETAACLASIDAMVRKIAPKKLRLAIQCRLQALPALIEQEQDDASREFGTEGVDGLTTETLIECIQHQSLVEVEA